MRDVETVATVVATGEVETSAMVITRPFTLADLLAMEEDDYLHEVIGGRLVVSAAPADPHMLAVVRLTWWFAEAEDAGFGIAGTAPRAVALDYAERGMLALDVPQPDLFFVREERRAIVEAGRPVQGVPDLVVEVLSPTTRAKDLPDGEKWDAYQRHGVPGYWIVDSEARTVRQYAYRGAEFVEAACLRPGDTLTWPLFPGMRLPVGRLFERRRAEPSS